jgi:hypothetical protein
MKQISVSGKKISHTSPTDQNPYQGHFHLPFLPWKQGGVISFGVKAAGVFLIIFIPQYVNKIAGD